MRRTLPILAMVTLAMLLVPPASGQGSPPGSLEVSLFARIGSPGQPEGIWVDDAGTVDVGTHNAGKGDADAPSRVFAFDPSGELVREYVIDAC